MLLMLLLQVDFITNICYIYIYIYIIIYLLFNVYHYVYDFE